MPRKKHHVRFGEPFKGLSTRREARFIGPNHAQSAIDCDTYSGALVGALGLGSSVAVNAGNPSALWIWPLGGGSWVVSGQNRWAMADERRWAMDDGNLTYFTQVGKRPQIADASGTSWNLGIVPMSVISWSGIAGNLNGSYAIAFTFQTFDGLEWNRQNFDLQFTFPLAGYQGLRFLSVWPSDTRVSAVRVWVAQVTGGSAGTYYLQATISDRATTSWDFSATPALNTEELTWNYGGYPANSQAYWEDRGLPVPAGTLYRSDHATAPMLTRLADKIHSRASGTAAAGSGIIFGAVGNVLRWTKNGYPQYWPIVNSFPLDHEIEAIIAYSGFVVVFAVVVR